MTMIGPPCSVAVDIIPRYVEYCKSKMEKKSFFLKIKGEIMLYRAGTFVAVCLAVNIPTIRMDTPIQ